ncbi:MAG: hypothetical protein GWO11_05430, partial [Desulfuromonadales bacterium]|nr:hypothetical protein [Desulfuromonadales bacterium]NIR33835.1 hypothetical protein [Desulfuromonadales bacterium]NIS39994.1 hypothetical protein [Desulfuromonadales bacterium]
MRLPPDNALVGRTLAKSRIGSALGLTVVEILREEGNILAPPATATLRAEDRLLLAGRLDRLEQLRGWHNLAIREKSLPPDMLLQNSCTLAETDIAEGSTLDGKTLAETDLRERLEINVLAVKTRGRVQWNALANREMRAGDTLLVHGASENLAKIESTNGFGGVRIVDPRQAEEDYRLSQHLMMLEVPDDSRLNGLSLGESRLGEALDMRVLLIRRTDGTLAMPSPEEELKTGNRLVAQGRPEDFQLLRALEKL